MRHAIWLLVTLVSLAGSFRPAAAAANVSQPAGLPAVSLEQARQAYLSAGFSIDPTLVWGWTAPPVETFRVHDVEKDRVLMVLVYASQAAAESARARTIDGSPRLVDGFGQSVWRTNVGLVEARQSALDRRYSSDARRMIGMSCACADVGQSALTIELEVDVDFEQALDGSTVHL